MLTYLTLNEKIEKRCDKNNFRLSLLAIILILLSICSSFICLLSIEKEGYELLFLLPISFAFIVAINFNEFYKRIKNFGFLIVIGLEFAKLVISPCLFVLGGFPLTITLCADENAILGILLLVYESLWISIALRKNIKIKKESNYIYQTKRLVLVLFILLFITIFICFMAPEILTNYRTIFQLGEEEFSIIEQGYIVNLYSGSFVKKLFLVIANYWLKPMRIIIPALLMLICKDVFKKKSKLICLLLTLTPLLFVDGTVARSLYFTIILLLFFNYLFKVKTRYMFYLMGTAFIFVIAYWYIRYSLHSSKGFFITFLAEKFNDYFSGFNIVSGIGNMPFSITNSLKYLIDDFIHSIPFSNTLFGLDATVTSRTFFNSCNQTSGGQVAATIVMGCYYLTPLFAPLFSFVFVRVSLIAGEKPLYTKDHLNVVVSYLVALYFALGIAVNDIGVTIGNFVQVICIVMIVILFCRKKVR